VSGYTTPVVASRRLEFVCCYCELVGVAVSNAVTAGFYDQSTYPGLPTGARCHTAAWRRENCRRSHASWSTNSDAAGASARPRAIHHRSSEAARRHGPLRQSCARWSQMILQAFPSMSDSSKHRRHALEQYMRVRRHTETLVAPLNPRTWRHSQCRRKSRQVASGPYTVLRDLPSVRQSSGLSSVRPATATCLIPITRPRAAPAAASARAAHPSSVGEILAYRRHVDAHMSTLLKSDSRPKRSAPALGLAHEEQHRNCAAGPAAPVQPVPLARYDRRWPRTNRDVAVVSSGSGGWWRSDQRRAVALTKGRSPGLAAAI